MKQKLWFIIFAVSSQFWLLAFFSTSLNSTRQGYISDLFILGNHHSVVYRLLSIASGVALFAFAQEITQKTKNKWRKKAIVTTKILAFLTVVDAVFVDTCSSLNTNCHPTGIALGSSVVHGIESILSISLLFLLCLYIAKASANTRMQITFCAVILFTLLALQLIGSYFHSEKGTWQRLFTLFSIVPFYYLLRPSDTAHL